MHSVNVMPLDFIGRTEDELEEAERSVLDCAPIALISWTVEGTITSWNRAAEVLYGLRAPEVIGTAIERLVPEHELENFRLSVARVRGGGEVAARAVCRLAAEGELVVEEQLFPVRDGVRVSSRVGCLARAAGTTVVAGPTPLSSSGAAGVLAPESELSHAAAEAAAAALARGESGAPEMMSQVLETADMVATDPNATVLILGETGVGKSWLARRIHQASPRASQPFLEISCASLGPELVESELFGHERGAFTSATEPKRGLVEAADGGTLFLDEIGELPLPAQAHLLSFLDTHRFRRVGGTRALSSDVRILAATNLDLEKAIAQGMFRKDLYYRLSVVPLQLPPLRARRDDIARLAREMLRDLAARRALRHPIVLTQPVVSALVQYDWPGNIRELRNVLERVLILNRGGPALLEHLPLEVRLGAPARGEVKIGTLEEIVQAHIKRVLEAAGGNRTRAADMLGISRSTLRRKLH